MRGLPALALLALVACEIRPRVATMTPEQIAREVTVERSPTKHLVTYSGMALGSDSMNGGVATEYYLRSFWRAGQTAPSHQLYVGRQYQASRAVGYARATDDTGAARTVTVLRADFNACSTSLGECTYAEHLAVDLPDAFVRARAATGFQIRVTGDTGRVPFVVEVPGNYVQGHLAALAAPGNGP